MPFGNRRIIIFSRLTQAVYEHQQAHAHVGEYGHPHGGLAQKGQAEKNRLNVFQEADNQIIASTVRAEVSFGPMNLGLDRQEVAKRVIEALNYMSISDLIDRPPHYLSGGEKKKVSIADIIAMKSEVIIFDEPTASLDAQNIYIFEEVLKRMSSESKTLVISTHDLEFAFRWADRIIVFSEGSIIADSDPATVFNNREMLKGVYHSPS